MKIVDNAGTIWLDVPEFARKQNKQRVTIYQWCKSGFILELGFILHRDVTGHLRIGIPLQHNSYSKFA